MGIKPKLHVSFNIALRNLNSKLDRDLLHTEKQSDDFFDNYEKGLQTPVLLVILRPVGGLVGWLDV